MTGAAPATDIDARADGAVVVLPHAVENRAPPRMIANRVTSRTRMGPRRAGAKKVSSMTRIRSLQRPYRGRALAYEVTAISRLPPGDHERPALYCAGTYAR